MARDKKTNDEKVIDGMSAIDDSISKMNKYYAKFNEWIDSAAIAGENEEAKQLIKEKLAVQAFIRQLETLKRKVEKGAYDSKALGNLGKLPDAIKSCFGILADKPDFSKLGINITKLFSGIEKSKTEIDKLNEILAPKPRMTLDARLAGVTDKTEEQDDFKAEYRKMLERIEPYVTPNAIPNPSANQGANASHTGILDIEGIIAEENKKK